MLCRNQVGLSGLTSDRLRYKFGVHIHNYNILKIWKKFVDTPSFSCYCMFHVLQSWPATGPPEGRHRDARKMIMTGYTGCLTAQNRLY